MCGGCGGHLTKPGRWTVCITGYAFAPVIILLSVWPLHTFVSKNLQIYRTLSHLCDICSVKRTTSWIHLHGIKLPVYLPDLTEKVLVNKFSNWCSNEPKTRLVYNYQTDFNVLGLRTTTLYSPGFHCFIYIVYISRYWRKVVEMLLPYNAEHATATGMFRHPPSSITPWYYCLVTDFPAQLSKHMAAWGVVYTERCQRQTDRL